MINALPVLTSVPMLNHAEQKLFSVTKVVDNSGKKKKKRGRGGSNRYLVQNQALRLVC